MSNIGIENPMNSQEEVQVQRVFLHLCDYQEKAKINKEIADLNALIAANRNKSFLEIGEESIHQATIKIEELQRQLEVIKNKPDKKISAADVSEMLLFLTQKAPNKREVEEMIWEVDENLDGFVDWGEFRLMFHRNILDQTGLEPSRMVRLCFSSCNCSMSDFS